MTQPPFAIAAALLVLGLAATAEPAAKPGSNRAAFEDPLVDISQACPGVVIELRYATSRNITGKPIYPPGARALLCRSVAERLNRAQAYVRERGFSLKVWDAYRPPSAQRVLWNAVRNPAYVVQPSAIGSIHGWAAAVDVTLVDFRGREVRMPTDFDSFSPAARYDYRGGDPEIAFNLSTLKRAMGEAGFRHIRDEWWHYSMPPAQGGGPIDVPLTGPLPGERIAKDDADEALKAAEAAKKKPRTERALFPRRAGETL